MKFGFALAFLSFALLLERGTVSADDLLQDSGAPVAKHESFRSKFALFDSAESGDWGILLRSDRSPLEGAAADYLELPRCSGSNVRRKELKGLGQGTEIFDVVYYDRSQVKTPPSSLHAVPYKPALLRDANGLPDYWQNFARFVGITCLPTRFHMTRQDGRSFMEYREGDAAWK